jgi:hypothetical protein
LPECSGPAATTSATLYPYASTPKEITDKSLRNHQQSSIVTKITHQTYIARKIKASFAYFKLHDPLNRASPFA